jgi:uncharacterized protein DUF6690
MSSRPLLFIGVLAAAFAVPYVLLDENLSQTAKSRWNRLWGKSASKTADPLADATRLTSSSAGLVMPSAAIEEIFRFDIQPQWVTSRWPRVSTVAGDGKQLGMRVAVVTGTRPDDIAGSLTYYFDDHHQLQRITFSGLSGDSRRLLAAVVTPNGLKSQPTTDAAYYIAGNPKKPSSQVTVRHLPVVRADEQARQEIAVDLKRSDIVRWTEKAAQEAEPSLLPNSYRKW